MKGEAVPMSSISPTLSEMKAAYLERKGMLVALKSRLNENEPPAGLSEGGSEAGEAATSPDPYHAAKVQLGLTDA